jgi:hypothetical protein
MLKGKRHGHGTSETPFQSFFFSFLQIANPAGIQPKSDRKLMFGSVPHNTNFDELNNRCTRTSQKKNVHTT